MEQVTPLEQVARVLVRQATPLGQIAGAVLFLKRVGVVAERCYCYCRLLLHDWAGNVGWAHDSDIGCGCGGVVASTDGEGGSDWAVGDIGRDDLRDWWENHSDKGHSTAPYLQLYSSR